LASTAYVDVSVTVNLAQFEPWDGVMIASKGISYYFMQI